MGDDRLEHLEIGRLAGLAEARASGWSSWRRPARISEDADIHPADVGRTSGPTAAEVAGGGCWGPYDQDAPGEQVGGASAQLVASSPKWPRPLVTPAAQNQDHTIPAPQISDPGMAPKQKHVSRQHEQDPDGGRANTLALEPVIRRAVAVALECPVLRFTSR